jgi:hypothetical protein
VTCEPSRSGVWLATSRRREQAHHNEGEPSRSIPGNSYVHSLLNWCRRRESNPHGLATNGF